MGLKPNIPFKPYQEEAADKVVKKDGNLIISHPVGSGKTLTGLLAFERLKEKNKANKALIVTPASLRNNYAANGITKFTTDKFVIYGSKQEVGKPFVVEPENVIPGKTPTYGIVSYDLFRKDPEKYIKAQGADTVIFDEIHKIKNEDSLTYTRLKETRPLYRNFIGLTGSVVSNTPADIVPIIDTMTFGQHSLGNKQSFETRFIEETKEGKKLKNPYLVSALLSPYVHHISPEKVTAQTTIPEKVVNTIEVPMSRYQTQLYRYTIDELDPLTKAKLRANVGKLSNTDLHTIFSKLIKARQVSNSISTLDKNISLEQSAELTPKIKRVMDDIEEHLTKTPDAQIVVHSNLIKGGIDVLEAGLKNRGVPFKKFVGMGQKGSTETKRQQAVLDYNSGKTKVLLLSSAGGEGLNLPNTTLFVTLDGHYNPEKIFQAEARGIRVGGLAHRTPENRKVMVNRYLSTIPLNKSEITYNIYQGLNPSLYFERFMRGEEVFVNPFKRIKGSDEIIYNIASRKDKLNKYLTGGLEKTAKKKKGVFSDLTILQNYYKDFEPQLLSGDYTTNWIDRQKELEHINNLRQFYSEASVPGNVVNIPRTTTKTPWIVPKYDTTMTPLDIFLQKTKPMTIPWGLSLGAGGSLVLQNKRLLKNYKFLGAMAPLLITNMFATYSLIRESNKPHYLISKKQAKSRSRFTDEQLLQLLRGQAIKQEHVKTDTHFIS